MREAAGMGNGATPLTVAVLNSNYYGAGKHAVVNEVTETLLANYAAHIDDDNFFDFLTTFYRRIERLMVKYEFYGIPFEHYLMHAARLSFARFQMKRQKKERSFSVYEQFNYNTFRIDTRYRYSNGQTYAGNFVPMLLSLLGMRESALDMGERRRLLIMTLKFSHWLTDTHVRRIASLVHYRYERMLLLVEMARIQALSQTYDVTTELQRRNRLYMRLLAEQYERCYAQRICEERVDEYNQESTCSRERIQRYNARIANRRVAPTNEFIAAVLNVSKGTVDSCAYQVKKRYAQWRKSYEVEYTDGSDGYDC